jgi:hypothetical protein
MTTQRRIARASRPAPFAGPSGSAPIVRIPPLLGPEASTERPSGPNAADVASTSELMAGATPANAPSSTIIAPVAGSLAGTVVGTLVASVNDSVAAPMSASASGGTPALDAHTDTLPHSQGQEAATAGLAARRLASGSAPIRLARGAIPIGPYTVAAIPAGRRAPDDMFAPRYLPELGKVVEQVLAAEAPMHVDLLARRVGGYFGIGRVTQRVSEQVRIALAGRGRWGDEENVVWRMDQDPAGVPPVRVAGSGPTARREIEEVPLSELAAAARIVVERAPNIQPTELVRDAARLLGFARITDRVTGRIVLGVQLALQRTLITLDNGRARLPD